MPMPNCQAWFALAHRPRSRQHSREEPVNLQCACGPVTEATPEYELFAIRYATRDARRVEHFIGGDPHDGPMPMDYFTWIAIGAERTFVIDTGFTEIVGTQRKRSFLRCPVDSLKLLRVDPNAVKDVILTHLHYDHVGNFHRFPVAQFHLQDRELNYATGHSMRHAYCAQAFEVEDVVGIVRLNFGRRVTFHDGAETLAPGISLHLTGGHTAGLQFVRVPHQARLGRGGVRRGALL